VHRTNELAGQPQRHTEQPPSLTVLAGSLGMHFGITHACSQFSDVSPPAVNGYFWRAAKHR